MSLSHKIEERYGLPTTVGSSIETNETLNTIFNHRSFRDFSQRQVDPDLMRILFSAAFSAPSKSDLQQARVIWVRDQHIKDEIAATNPDLHGWIASAPEFIVWLGDNSLCQYLAEVHGNEYVNNHLDQFMNPAVDAGIVLATFLVAAESKGLGCCPVSSIRNTPTEIAEILKLPEFVFPVAGMVLGYPAENEGSPVTMRLPQALTVMENSYTVSEEEAVELAEDYSLRRAAQSTGELSEQRAVEIFGISDNYRWSEDKTRQYGLPERADWGAFIKAQGFSLD